MSDFLFDSIINFADRRASRNALANQNFLRNLLLARDIIDTTRERQRRSRGAGEIILIKLALLNYMAFEEHVLGLYFDGHRSGKVLFRNASQLGALSSCVYETGREKASIGRGLAKKCEEIIKADKSEIELQAGAIPLRLSSTMGLHVSPTSTYA